MDDKSRQANKLARLAASAVLAAAMVTACGGGGSAEPGAEHGAELGAEPSAVAGPAAQAAAAELTTSADTATAAPAGLAFALGKKNTSTPAPKTVAQPANTSGRLLASNCFQCHGTLGTGGFESIRGKEASEVLEFMTKTASKNIMAAHAQGYTPAQLQKIIAYLQQ